MELADILERSLQGMGFELVAHERQRGLVRVFIDKPDGIDVDDCAAASHQLTRVFEVEGVAYDRLEVSSPGLDRPLRKMSDFVRFQGEDAHIKVRVPRTAAKGGVQRNFTGRIAVGEDGRISLTREGATAYFELHEIDKARLIPKF